MLIERNRHIKEERNWDRKTRGQTSRKVSAWVLSLGSLLPCFHPARPVLTQVLEGVLPENSLVGRIPVWSVLLFWEPLEDTFECAHRTSAPTAYLRLTTATPVSELWGRLAAKFLDAAPSARVLTCFYKFHFLIIHRAHCSTAWLYFRLRRRWHSPANSMEVKNGSHISGSFNPSKA